MSQPGHHDHQKHYHVYLDKHDHQQKHYHAYPDKDDHQQKNYHDHPDKDEQHQKHYHGHPDKYDDQQKHYHVYQDKHDHQQKNYHDHPDLEVLLTENPAMEGEKLSGQNDPTFFAHMTNCLKSAIYKHDTVNIAARDLITIKTIG